MKGHETARISEVRQLPDGAMTRDEMRELMDIVDAANEVIDGVEKVTKRGSNLLTRLEIALELGGYRMRYERPSEQAMRETAGGRRG